MMPQHLLLAYSFNLKRRTWNKVNEANFTNGDMHIAAVNET